MSEEKIDPRFAPTMSLPWCFPVFYQSVIKERLTLKQYDAVNLLLLGKRYDECIEMAISQSMAANYVSGKKKVNKDIITTLLECPLVELKRRLQALGLQNLDQGVYCLKYLLYSGELQLNEYDRARLLHMVRVDKDFYSFLAEAFLLAIKCPPQDIRALTDDEKRKLNAYQIPVIIGDIDKALTPEQIAASESVLNEVKVTSADEANHQSEVNVLKSFNLALHRTRLLSFPQDFQFVSSFFYTLTGIDKNHNQDKYIADTVRPYYEKATLHAVTVEEWCVLVGPSMFRDYIPRDEYTTLCILVEGDEESIVGFEPDSFRNDADFLGTFVHYRCTELPESANLRVTWVFLTGETR